MKKRSNMFNHWVYLLYSYLIGSIPFSFLVPLLFKKINVMEVGWKKSSATNVYKNVGIIEGIISGLLDAAKGFFIVYLAMHNFGFSDPWLVAFACAVVFGHNWSIFLSFAGGRGLATYAGALLAFSPTLAILGVTIYFALGALLDGSISTIIALLVVIFVSPVMDFWETAGIYTALIFLPLLFKRLTPLRDFFHTKTPWELFKARLVFDDNQWHELRYIKLFQQLTNKDKGLQ